MATSVPQQQEIEEPCDRAARPCTSDMLPAKGVTARHGSREQASRNAGSEQTSNDQMATSIRTRQWSLGPHSWTAFRATAVTRSASESEAKTKSSCRVAVCGVCRALK